MWHRPFRQLRAVARPPEGCGKRPRTPPRNPASSESHPATISLTCHFVGWRSCSGFRPRASPRQACFARIAEKFRCGLSAVHQTSEMSFDGFQHEAGDFLVGPPANSGVHRPEVLTWAVETWAVEQWWHRQACGLTSPLGRESGSGLLPIGSSAKQNCPPDQQ